MEPNNTRSVSLFSERPTQTVSYSATASTIAVSVSSATTILDSYSSGASPARSAIHSTVLSPRAPRVWVRVLVVSLVVGVENARIDDYSVT